MPPVLSNPPSRTGRYLEIQQDLRQIGSCIRNSSVAIDTFRPVQETVAVLCVYDWQVPYENNESTARSPGNRIPSDSRGMGFARPRGHSFAWLGFRPERVAELCS